MGNAATAKKIMVRGALSLCTRQFQMRVRAARGAMRPSFAKPFAQENRQRVLNGTHSVLKFAPQSTRGEGRYSMSGARAVQRFWYGWKMWSFAFTATWHACPQSEGLGSAANLSDAAS